MHKLGSHTQAGVRSSEKGDKKKVTDLFLVLGVTVLRSHARKAACSKRKRTFKPSPLFR